MFQGRKHSYVFVLCLFLGISSLFAQQSQIDQSILYQGESSTPSKQKINELQLRETEIVEDESKKEAVSTSSGDSDLGDQYLLKRGEEKYKSFSVFGSWNGFYTSNAYLEREHWRSDCFMVGQVGASYMPKIRPDLFGEITYLQQFFRYDKFEDLDFDSLNIGGGLTYLMHDLWDVAVTGRYNYNRLSHAHPSTDGPEDTAFFWSHTLSVTFQKIFEINRAQYIYVGESNQVAMSQPLDQERDDYALFTGYNVKLTRSVEAQAGYRFNYALYENAGRQDITQTIFSGVTYKPCDYASISANISMALNNSNISDNDYEALNSGVGVSAQYRF